MSADVKPRVKIIEYLITLDATAPMDPKYRLWTVDPLQPITKFLPTYEACHEVLNALWAEKESRLFQS